MGNVITKKGKVIFRPEEIDSDDEIPAPFCYQKHKDTLGLRNDAPPNLYSIVHEQDDEEDLIDKEYKKMRSGKNSSMDPSEMAPSSLLNSLKKGQGRQQLPTETPGEEDFYERLTKPIKPVAKSKIMT